MKRSMLLGICALTGLGCTRTAKPVELVAYEHRSREAYRPTLEVRQPELLAQSRTAHRKAVNAWRRKDAKAAIHHTRLADIYWRTAEALSHTKDLDDATVAYTRQATRHAQSKALASERLAAVELDIRRLQRLKVLRSELVKVRRTARQEKRATAARLQIDRAMKALQIAEDLAAERHALGPLNKARQSLQNAFETFNAGRYAEASAAADLAQADAAAAAEVARPLHEAEAEQRALDAELRAMLEEIAGAPWADARIEKRGLVVSLRELFAPANARLSQSIRVQPVARLAQAHERFALVVEGHTDNRGLRAENQKLSTARADAVAQVLVTAGVAKTRVTKQGKGDREPLADNGTARGRALNRRVEVVFLRPDLNAKSAP